MQRLFSGAWRQFETLKLLFPESAQVNLFKTIARSPVPSRFGHFLLLDTHSCWKGVRQGLDLAKKVGSRMDRNFFTWGNKLHLHSTNFSIALGLSHARWLLVVVVNTCPDTYCEQLGVTDCLMSGAREMNKADDDGYCLDDGESSFANFFQVKGAIGEREMYQNVRSRSELPFKSRKSVRKVNC